MKIGHRDITLTSEPFIIAEVGINHNGDLDRALKMIEVAKTSGADCVKFQTFKAKEFVSDPEQMFTYQSQGKSVTESMLAMFERYELPADDWQKIKAKCDAENIVFMSTPQNYSDLEILLEIGVDAIKIGSDDFTNLPLLKSYRQTGLPLIISCGMADSAEIYHSLETAGYFDGHPLILLHCISQYPTPPEDINLEKLKTLRSNYPDLILGFSDHSQGPLASSLATVYGANVFEKHFTLDNQLPGPDHWFSENPVNLKIWCDSIRQAWKMRGSGQLRPTSEEVKMRKLARRSLVAAQDIKKGEVFNPSNLELKRPGDGLPSNFLDKIIGLKASRDLKATEQIQFGDFSL